MKKSIYISHAWGDSEDSEEEIALNGLCNVLKDYGFEVVYDRTHFDYQQSLPDFFRIIGEGGIVVPIVGQKYLKRINCLLEVANIICAGKLDNRVFPLILSSASAIFDKTSPAFIDDIFNYWEAKQNGLQTAFSYSNSLKDIKVPVTEGVPVSQQIKYYINQFCDFISAHKQFNYDSENETNLTEFVQFIIHKTEEENEKPYYQKIVGEYFGRDEDIEFLDEFLRNEEKHFLLLYGVGGMGKSHLLSVCLDKFNYERKFFWIRADKNFELRNLFEKCGLRYPREMGNPTEICKQFLNEFSTGNLFLIIDDYYEIIDTEVRQMLPDLACLPSGKLLIISRAVPKEIENRRVCHHQLLPLKRNDFKKAMLSYISTEEKRYFTDNELNKIFDKAQGYPLGGQLIIRLADFGEDLDDILSDIPKFEAELDPEGRRFSERLLDNIFKKSNVEEIALLSEFSALFGFPAIEEIRQLPSFTMDSFNTLVNRRKFITKDSAGKFNAHAMVRDYAYSRLADKEAIHRTMGAYCERKLKAKEEIDWEITETVILHLKKVGDQELRYFGQRMFNQFRNRDVKTIIEQSLNSTIRNYKNLIEVYPLYMPYFNELGIALRKNNQRKLAIDILLKGLAIEPDNVVLLNELGITYRESNQKQLAIDTFNEAIKVGPNHLPSYNELGITYLENNQKQLAIDALLKGLSIEADNVKILNQLGITYRENNQKQEAIDTLLKGLTAEPDNVIIINELGITYREDNQVEKAIYYWEKALSINPKNPIVQHNLLLVYLFFKPIKTKALEYFNKLNAPPYNSTFRSNRRAFQVFISNLDEIFDIVLVDPKIIDRYVFFAIQYKAYDTALPLLFKLHERSADNPRIVSRLGKTLSNRTIARNEEGWVYLKEAIKLLTVNQNRKEKQEHIIFYFYSLLLKDKLELLAQELSCYKEDISQDSSYKIFMAAYYQKLGKPETEIVNSYQDAINLAETDEIRIKVTESLLRYLVSVGRERYSKLFDQLMNNIAELVNKKLKKN